VAYTRDGYADAGDPARAIAGINRSGARILLVAKGVPRQECWIAAHAAELAPPVLMGVGALFDFYSGAVPRAPLAMRRLRMEWLFRLLVEPRRMCRRYVLGNPAFLYRALRLRLNDRE
jgi:N-acetylglucosaminyldiphosphoundecaprenol N-acetyl-beta-D-mannosaminyltransferase